MLRKIRLTLAIVFFISLTLLFADFTGTLHSWLGWMAKVQALEAALALNVAVIALLVVLTLVFGRIYCSVICPLGVFQDGIAWLRRKKNKYSYSRAVSWLRYTVLAVFVVALLAGVSVVVSLLAPYSAFGRMAQSLFQPLWLGINNLLASAAERMDSYAFYSVDVWVRSLPVLVIAALTFVVVAVLAWRGGRTYCNTICPVGTVLSFLSRFSWMKVRFVEDKCRNCSACSRNCKAACIDYKTHTVDYSRCVVCGDCIDKCKFDALKYAPALPGKKDGALAGGETRKPAGENAGAPAGEGPDAGRRSFLLATAIATAAAAKAQKDKTVDGGLAIIEERAIPTRVTPLTPPGSLSAGNLAKHCTGCQLCVSECPNHVLRPSSDLLHIMQPTMSYERGYCRPECTRCSEVCPAGAIRPISHEDKASTQIGHAVWVKQNCVVLTDGVSCGNCARHCPAGAIEMVPSDPDDQKSPRVPAVNEARCIGCGACENLCPARPFAAIYVEGHEVHKQI